MRQAFKRLHRRPVVRASIAGFVALALVSLNLQHAIYLCAATAHERPSAARGEGGGCHDEAGAPVDHDAQPKGHACCSSSPMIVGSSSLKDLAARGSMLAGASLAPPGPVHPLAALPAVAQRAGARSSPHAAYSRVRPHLALRTLLL
jgi:hypothetical protein